MTAGKSIHVPLTVSYAPRTQEPHYEVSVSLSLWTSLVSRLNARGCWSALLSHFKAMYLLLCKVDDGWRMEACRNGTVEN